MERKHLDKNFTALTAVFGILCSGALGYPIFGLGISQNHLLFFHFLAFSVMASIPFAFFEKGRVREGLALFILLFALAVLVLNEFRGSQFFVFTLFAAALLAGLWWFAATLFVPLNRQKLARPLSLAGILALFFAAASFTEWILFRELGMPFNPFANLSLGFFLGLGLGIGFELGEILTKAIANRC